jgi:hypothetical protein
VVFRIHRVDREDQVIPQIRAIGEIVLRDAACALCFCFFLDGLRKFNRELMTVEHGEDVHAGCAVLAQHFLHAAHWTAVLLAPARDAYDDDVAFRGAAIFRRRNENIARQLETRLWNDEAEILCGMIHTDNRFPCAVENANDTALRFSALLPALDARDHTVAIYRGVHPLRRDVQVAVPRIGDHEARPALDEVQRPDHEIDARGERVPAGFAFVENALRSQLIEQRAEGFHVGGFDAELGGELLGRKRMAGFRP